MIMMTENDHDDEKFLKTVLNVSHPDFQVILASPP